MKILLPTKYYIWLLFLILLSCKKEPLKELKQLPIEKLFIVESYFYKEQTPNEKQTSKFFMDLFGYCELDKNFNVKVSVKMDDGNFYTSEMIVPDSLRRIISETIINHSIDTVYERLGKYQFTAMRYFHNKNDHIYFLIMEKEDREKITIRFYQNELPEDLRFIYRYLYYEPREIIGKNIPLYNNIDSLHRIFDKEMMYNLSTVPSPPTKFEAPNIKRY